jgi:spermidine synthase
MKPWKTLGTDKNLVLQERDGEYVLRINGQVLMSSARHGSEESLAEIGLKGLERDSPRVLIGGLGLGYTLRATLDRMPAQSQVMVAELSPGVVEWNKGVLGPLAGNPLDDPRVEVRVADVAVVVRREGRFDAILLDVDNGPTEASANPNHPLYSSAGIHAFKAALRKRGCLAVWSASEDDQFVPRMKKAGLEAERIKVPVRDRGRAIHWLYVGRLPAEGHTHANKGSPARRS